MHIQVLRSLTASCAWSGTKLGSDNMDVVVESLVNEFSTAVKGVDRG